MSRRTDMPGTGAELKRAVTEAHSVLDALLSKHLAAVGLTIGESDVLTVVHLSDHPPAPTEIAGWLNLTGAGVTGRLDSLERRGLLSRQPNPGDGRSVLVQLTSEGSTLAKKVMKAKDEVVTQTIMDGIGPERAQALTEDLDALTEAIRDAVKD